MALPVAAELVLTSVLDLEGVGRAITSAGGVVVARAEVGEAMAFGPLAFELRLGVVDDDTAQLCLLYTSPSPRDS